MLKYGVISPQNGTPLQMPQQERPQADCEAFGAYAVRWYTLYKKPSLRPNSRHMYENVLNTHLLPAFGGLRLDAITPDMLQRFIIAYADKSKSIIDKVMMLLRQVFDAAVEESILPKSPVSRLKPPAGTQKERLPIPYENVQEATTALLEHKDGALPLLLMYTGLRRGEALALRWEDIRASQAHISKNAVMIGNKTTLGDPKTTAAVRSVPVPPFVLEKLGKPGKGYVFGGAKLYTQSKVKRLFERVQADIRSMQGITPHCLRHTYTMLLRRAGVDAATAQYLLGHEEYETTANTYTHIDKMDIGEAETKFFAFVGGALTLANNKYVAAQHGKNVATTAERA